MPCHTQWIRAWMPPSQQSHGFFILGISSRVGDMLCKLGYGILLNYFLWRYVPFPALTSTLTVT